VLRIVLPHTPALLLRLASPPPLRPQQLFVAPIRVPVRCELQRLLRLDVSVVSLNSALIARY
jgi:hypothetical protein